MLHPLGWLTANVRPPMTIFALRAVPVFAATVKLIVCGPEPLPGTPEIHGGTPLLVHPHPAAVFTANELAPPPAAAL
jgi:hypothetical protein